MTPRAQHRMRFRLCALLCLASPVEQVFAQAENSRIKPITRHQGQPRPANLESIYSQIARGELSGAEQALRSTVTQHPEHIDAMLALAGLYQLQANETQSVAWRHRAQAHAPSHPEALASQAHANADGLPAAQAESQLRTHIAQRPGASPLYFALGNQLAEQGRWHEAQFAYEQALRGDNANPDYRYNLAVSLDRLHQNHLARHHYRLAQQHRQSRPAFFSSVALQQRLTELDHD